MSEKTNNRLYLMITITNRVKGATHFIDFYRAFGAPWYSPRWDAAPPATTF